MSALLGRLKGPDSARAGRARLTAAARPALIYAIGDVHGCLDELLLLERLIVADAAATGGEKWIVMVGDYIDRGPKSAQVIDHLLGAPPAGFRRITLAGNHEQMLLAFLANPRREGMWLDNGGLETLQSYGIVRLETSPAAVASALRARMPDEHAEFLADLPVSLSVPGFVFVHAGLRPGVELDLQVEADLLWTREPYRPAGVPQFVVVHGHTPVIEPEIGLASIGIDTGAFATGRLTALRIDSSGQTAFLATSGNGTLW